MPGASASAPSAESVHSGCPCSMRNPLESQGPPINTGKGRPLRDAGRLMTRPRAPSSPCWRRNTTVRTKEGSWRIDFATRNEPARDAIADGPFMPNGPILYQDAFHRLMLFDAGETHVKTLELVREPP